MNDFKIKTRYNKSRAQYQFSLIIMMTLLIFYLILLACSSHNNIEDAHLIQTENKLFAQMKAWETKYGNFMPLDDTLIINQLRKSAIQHVVDNDLECKYVSLVAESDSSRYSIHIFKDSTTCYLWTILIIRLIQRIRQYSMPFQDNLSSIGLSNISKMQILKEKLILRLRPAAVSRLHTYWNDGIVGSPIKTVDLSYLFISPDHTLGPVKAMPLQLWLIANAMHKFPYCIL